VSLSFYVVVLESLPFIGPCVGAVGNDSPLREAFPLTCSSFTFYSCEIFPLLPMEESCLPLSYLVTFLQLWVFFLTSLHVVILSHLLLGLYLLEYSSVPPISIYSAILLNWICSCTWILLEKCSTPYRVNS